MRRWLTRWEYLLANCLREFSYAHALQRSLGPPRIFQLETTNHCPYTCIMCPRTEGMTRALGHMDLGLFREIVDQLRPAWQMEGSASGVGSAPLLRLLHFGEPLVYRHFRDSIEHCHRRGFQVYISTNPSVWTEQRIEEMLETGVDRVQVMFDGMDDATSMAIRGTAASFVRGEKNLRTLGERKVARGLSRPHLTVQMIRQPRNAHQWNAFLGHWKDFPGVDGVYLDYYSTFAGDRPEVNAIGAELAARDDAQARELARMEVLAQWPCVYPWHSVSVTWDGKVVPCCRDHDAATVLGDLRRSTLAKIWNGAPIRRLRADIASGRPATPMCATCREPSLEVGPPTVYPLAFLARRR